MRQNGGKENGRKGKGEIIRSRIKCQRDKDPASTIRSGDAQSIAMFFSSSARRSLGNSFGGLRFSYRFFCCFHVYVPALPVCLTYAILF